MPHNHNPARGILFLCLGVFVFSIHQLHDLKQEKRKREAALRDKAGPPP